MLADLTYSKIADGRRRNEIQGELGTLLVDSISNPKKIVFVGRDKEERVLYHDPDPEFWYGPRDRGIYEFRGQRTRRERAGNAITASQNRPWD